jgi:hypothetical protein
MFAKVSCSSILALILLFEPCSVFASDFVFSGSLERVRHQSISVRLANGRLVDALLPKRADLSSDAIAAHYNIGDQVRMASKPVKPVYDPVAALHMHMLLKDLRLLRRASTEEVAQVVAILSWQAGENFLRQPSVMSAGGGSELERIRKVNLEYASKLPNFVADETATRYSSDIGAREWRLEDTIESEIAVKDGRLARQHIRRNGQTWDHPFNDLDRMHWAAFGRELRPVFDPTCPTKIEFSGSQEAGGKQLLVYRFSSPPGGCFGQYPLREAHYKSPYNPARTGRILVDAQHGNVIRYQEEAGGFPEHFFADRRVVEEAWDFVKIGEVSYLVPVSAEFVSRRADGVTRRTVVEYKNHRHFEASTTVTFDKDN